MTNSRAIIPDQHTEKSFPKEMHVGQITMDSYASTQKREQLLLVLPAPPLPLNQGYRHAAYNDIIQLSRLRDLHILICNGKMVYDFHRDSYELNYKELNSLPGVKSVSFFELKVDWEKPLWKRIFHQVLVLMKHRRLIEDTAALELSQKIIKLCSTYNIKDIHLGITINLFIDAFLNLRKAGSYKISFTAHDIDADKILIRMKENLVDKQFGKVITNLLTYWIFLLKEIHACRKSRFVISMAYRDFKRLTRKNVNAFFIPPYLHTLPTNRISKTLPEKPTLVIFGHIAFSAAGNGIELFMEKVVTAVKEKVSGVIIKIVGKDASPSVISKCKQLGVFYQEYVEDPEELWNETTVLASPLLVSKGIRIRILEAVYRGIPVVCTEQSATGFFRPEEFLRITNDFDSFANHCIELMTDTKKYRLEQHRINEYLGQNLSEDIIKLKWKNVWSEECHDFSSSKNFKKIITETV
ncbi:MAG: glycosyltransferase family 4 protein [Melioribacter sp.]|nr:glycosyltransferase family 4 protein [Melioribacter sp.]